jgi:serine/threonine protein kinase
MEPCLSDDDVASYVDQALEEEERDRVLRHAATCGTCRRLISMAAREPLASDDPTRFSAHTPVPPAPAPPQRVGRYALTRAIGQGAMGVVYEAHDPDLRRRIAVKLLDPSGPAGDRGEARLLREAQGLAQIAHPNVISIFDVGTSDGRTFLAMELVEGGSIGEWLRAAPRSWQEVLGVFIAAGRGLAAAHAAGLVHRDFKPANVLIGRDGRPRVTDFGLVRRGGSTDGAMPALGDDVPTVLTVPGSLVGTPAYMAPEQIWGDTADHVSDQFSFCVALYEGLAGTRPYAGSNVAQILVEIDAGRIAPPPASGVPPRIWQTVSRGLRAAPAARFPSMDALLLELERPDDAPGRPWMTRAVLIALAILVAVAVTIAILSSTGPPSEPPQLPTQ